MCVSYVCEVSGRVKTYFLNHENLLGAVKIRGSKKMFLDP